MHKVLIYSPIISTRLKYILYFIFEEVLQIPYQVIDNPNEIVEDHFIINYSNQQIEKAHLQIEPIGILFDETLNHPMIEIFTWNGKCAFFKTKAMQIPFDLFGAAFYLVSRFEEYLPYEPDVHHRYPVDDSLAYKHHFLKCPLVDEWLMQMKSLMLEWVPNLKFADKKMTFMPSYDIDMAYSYKGKGLFRNIGGGLKDLLEGRWKDFGTRVQVTLGNKKDPFDSFDNLDELHSHYALKPIYFFLVGKNGRYDKNILPNHPLMKTLISRIQTTYQIGVHPSYNSSDDEEILSKEISILGQTRSRQHYIRFQLPQTYNTLINQGIKEDYSMGYGSMNGFRASTAHPFFWFDVKNNRVTDLRIFPFCFMECNSKFEQDQQIDETYAELLHYLKVTNEVKGNLITIWHNFSLGTDPAWYGWKIMYQKFLETVSSVK